jgi:cytochrome c oxidase cbb3-type subunit 3
MINLGSDRQTAWMRVERIAPQRHRRFWTLMFAAICLTIGGVTAAQEGEPRANPQHQTRHGNMTPEQRAAATRAFLGLGPAPDRAAAERGKPLYAQNCAFCHGPQARGATAPSLVTSDVVLSDDDGERLSPFLRTGRPEKGMPAFATLTGDQRKDIAEFLHAQVEDVANRGTYHVLNILIGDAAKGRSYVAAHCMGCHRADAFAHLAAKFHSPEQLQRGWIWPARSSDASLAVSAIVKTARGELIAGRVTEVSDFRIALVDDDGRKHVIERQPGVEVLMRDPLSAHQAMIMTLRNDDMHDVTAYLWTLR